MRRRNAAAVPCEAAPCTKGRPLKKKLASRALNAEALACGPATRALAHLSHLPLLKQPLQPSAPESPP